MRLVLDEATLQILLAVLLGSLAIWPSYVLALVEVLLLAVFVSYSADHIPTEGRAEAITSWVALLVALVPALSFWVYLQQLSRRWRRMRRSPTYRAAFNRRKDLRWGIARTAGYALWIVAMYSLTMFLAFWACYGVLWLGAAALGLFTSIEATHVGLVALAAYIVLVIDLIFVAQRGANGWSKIAEDAEWTLATVPFKQKLTYRHLARNVGAFRVLIIVAIIMELVAVVTFAAIGHAAQSSAPFMGEWLNWAWVVVDTLSFDLLGVLYNISPDYAVIAPTFGERLLLLALKAGLIVAFVSMIRIWMGVNITAYAKGLVRNIARRRRTGTRFVLAER